MLSVFGNPVIWARPVDSDHASDLVSGMRATYAKRSGGPFLLYSPFPTPNLTSLGVSPVGHPPCMVRMPGVGDVTPDADGLNVRRVNDQEGLDDFERTLVEAYPIDEVQPWRRGVMMGLVYSSIRVGTSMSAISTEAGSNVRCVRHRSRR